MIFEWQLKDSPVLPSLKERRRGFSLSLIKPKTVGIPDLFYYEPAYQKIRSEPFEDYLANYLSKNWPIFESTGYSGVVFLYDEFHTVIDKKTKGQYVLSDFIAALNEVAKKRKQICRCVLWSSKS